MSADARETFFNHPKNPWRYPEEHPEWRPPSTDPTDAEAREQAWRKFWDARYEDYGPRHDGFFRGWDARGQYDERRIAALVAYTQHMALCPAWVGKPCVCGLDDALRALAGQ